MRRRRDLPRLQCARTALPPDAARWRQPGLGVGAAAGRRCDAAGPACICRRELDQARCRPVRRWATIQKEQDQRRQQAGSGTSTHYGGLCADAIER